MYFLNNRKNVLDQDMKNFSSGIFYFPPEHLVSFLGTLKEKILWAKENKRVRFYQVKY